MSNEEINNDASASTEVIDPIVEDGQVEELGEASVIEEPDFFDYTDVADKVVKIQVNGEEVTVPLQEALAGYQRQADYTRKTQELSEQRKQVEFAATLAQSLQEDPAGTLQALQQHYGVGTAQPIVEEDEWLDPAEKQMRQLEQRIAAFEQSKAMDELTRTIDKLQGKYGEDFNPDEVVAKAIATGMTDLEAVFKQVAFDKIYSKASESSKKLADEQARVQAKRSATIVSTGASSKGGSQTATTAPKTVFEAFEQAKKGLGL
jgi:hypothetical protein